MNKFRTRLTLIFIALIGFSVLSSGVLMVKVVENSYMDGLQESLQREMNVIGAFVSWPTGEALQQKRLRLQALAEQLAALSEARFTFVDLDGTPLGDSLNDPEKMDNHLDRPEIRKALEHGVGYSVRHSNTVKLDMINAAMAFKDEAGQIVGFVRIGMSLNDISATTSRLWMLLIVGLAAYFLIAGLISYRLARGLTKPLEKATQVAKQISRLNYQARVHVDSSDEFGQLAKAINSMADSMQIQMARIQEGETRLKNVLDNMISGVLLIDKAGSIVLMNRTAEDILGYAAVELIGSRFGETNRHQELTRLIGECLDRQQHIRDDLLFYYPVERVLEANLVPVTAGGEYSGIVIVLHDITAIRRLERMRSEFVANVSHELRTPITAVKGFAETLMSGALDDRETAMAFLKIIYDESDRLNRLIEDTLALSKIESKQSALQFAPIELDVFMDGAIGMIEREAASRGIAIERQVDEGLFIEADEDRLRQIVINLLTNAINYTPEGGKVKVTVEAFVVQTEPGHDDDLVKITVKDTGIGIPKKDLPRIFERFYRVDKARSRSSGGTGLGLSIVKHLVELHRGTIRVDSVVGAGTSFIIELPVIQSQQL